MSNLKLTKQGDRIILRSDRNLGDRYLLLFILTSTLIHSLSFFVFQMYKPSHPKNKDKDSSKPIELVMIPPEESSEKPPLETQKRALENSVVKQSDQPQKTAANKTIGDRLSPKLIAQPFPPIRILKPGSNSPRPNPPISKPESNSPQPSPPIPKPDSNSPQPNLPIPKPESNSPQPSPPIPITIPKPGSNNPQPTVDQKTAMALGKNVRTVFEGSIYTFSDCFKLRQHLFHPSL